VDIQVFKPKNEILRKHINNYYIFQQEDKKEISYLTFPNPYSIVSVLNNVELKHFPNAIVAEFNSNKSLISDLTLSYRKPILIRYKGIIKEISICFKPLGLNAFIEQSKEPISEKTPFFPYVDYKEKMGKIINVTNTDEIILELESYLLSKLSNFEHPFLHQFINDVEINARTSIGELSNKYGVSQKTLIKHTKSHLGRTPSEFIKVVRFHKAMKEYFKNEKSTLSLTQVGYAVSFFDQAHMIKDFKSLTGFTPRKFFKNLNPTKGELNWIFL
jgi:AraC-like DNA-binding protein